MVNTNDRLHAHWEKMKTAGDGKRPLPFEQVKDLQVVKDIENLGWKIRIIYTDTVEFSFPAEYAIPPREINTMHLRDLDIIDSLGIMPEKVMMYPAKWIRTIAPIRDWRNVNKKMYKDSPSRIHSFDNTSKTGWEEGLKYVYNNLVNKLARREKEGWKFLKTPKERHDARGYLSGRKFGF